MHVDMVQSQHVENSGHRQMGQEDIRPLQERDLESLSPALSPTHRIAPPPAPQGVKHSAGNDHASDSTFKPWCLAGAVV